MMLQFASLKSEIPRLPEVPSHGLDANISADLFFQFSPLLFFFFNISHL